MDTKQINSADNLLNLDLDHILNQTSGLWEELRGKRTFITGGTGFFGRWLLESFVRANDRLNLNASVLVLTRNKDTFRKSAPLLASNPAVKFQVGDIRNFRFPVGDFSYIIHAAASPSVGSGLEERLSQFDTIVGGTRRVLDFAAQFQPVKFLLISSGAVYGRQSADMDHLPEDYSGAPDPADGDSLYGEAKRAAELLCGVYARQYKMEMKIARCFTFVGPHLPLNSHYAIGNFILDGLNGDTIKVNGDGTPYRSYLYAADLAIWLWTILFKGESCRPYNVGSEEDITVADLAHTVAQYFEKPPAIEIAGIPIAGQKVGRYVPSTKRAREECHLRQTIYLTDAIRRTILFHRHNT